MTKRISDVDSKGRYIGIILPKKKCPFCHKVFLKRNLPKHQKRCPSLKSKKG